MALVLVIVIAITIIIGNIFGTDFWENYLAQFLATVFGVVSSILLAWGFWRFQQSSQRNQLKKDLLTEAKVNSERIQSLQQLIINILNKRTNELTWDDPLIKNMLNTRYRLRTAAMKNISKPEHLVLVSKLELADYLEWLLPQTELYNVTLSETLDRFWSASYEEKRYKKRTIAASVSYLNESMYPRIFRLEQAFDIIIAKEKELLRG